MGAFSIQRLCMLPIVQSEVQKATHRSWVLWVGAHMTQPMADKRHQCIGWRVIGWGKNIMGISGHEVPDERQAMRMEGIVAGWDEWIAAQPAYTA